MAVRHVAPLQSSMSSVSSTTIIKFYNQLQQPYKKMDVSRTAPSVAFGR
jgi:hypothetical protein